MEQAIITMLDGQGNDGKSIKVQFNPSEYATTHALRFADEAPASGSPPKLQFVAEKRPSMKLKLTLDGFTKANTLDPEKAADVYADLAFFRALVSINEELHRPPYCRFSWGSFKFMGSVENMSINYTMFASGGKPIRATVELQIVSAEDKKIALQSPDRTKRVVLTQGTPLYAVAFESYGDPGEWRRIAMANRIKNPRKLPEGTVLTVPPMEFV